MFQYKICNNLNYLNPIETILKNRGIEDSQGFINPCEKYLEDLNNFSTIALGKKLIDKAINNKSKVTILFDCDVDGYTSGAIMYQVCKQLGLETNYVIHQGKEHGLDEYSIDKIIDQNPNLLIIPDAGSENFEIILKFLFFADIDILVLDHHEVDKEILNSSIQFDKNTKIKYNTYFEINNLNNCLESECVIINNQLENKIKDKSMTGVGIVYKFIKYLEQNGFEKQYKLKADDYLDLVALGMIADMFDAKELQSRYLVFKGIEQINKKQNKNQFIKYISSKIQNDATIIDIGFKYAPLINSLIRFGDMDDKNWLVKAMINDNETILNDIRGKGQIELSCQEYVYRKCEHYKRKQKKIIEKISIDLFNQINNFGLNNVPIIVCNADGIDKNLTGLLANKIANEYQKPCLLIREDGDLYSGSARGYNKGSIQNLKNFLENTNLFFKLSGHANAFGVNIEKNKIGLLFDYLNNLNDVPVCINVDGILTNCELNNNFVNNVLKYEYLWGCGVDKPKFVIKLVIDKRKINIIGSKGNTITFYNNGLKYIMFNASDELIELITQEEKNENNNLINVELLVGFWKNNYDNITSNQVIIENYNLIDSK